MTKTVEIKKSGINTIDNKWGGLYNGSTYIIHGPAKSGKTTLALQHAYNTASRGEQCVMFTDVRPRKLIVAAHAMGMNIQPLIDSGKLIIVRMVSPRMQQNNQDRDTLLSEYLYEILNAVNEFNPSSIIFDELTSYVDFNDKELFLDVFNELVEQLEEMLITSIFVLQEGVNDNVQKKLEEIATGNIRLNKILNNSEEVVIPNRMKVISHDDYSEAAVSVNEQEIKIAAMA